MAAQERVGRRGLIAGAAVLAAGLLAKEAAPVAATHQPEDVLLGANTGVTVETTLVTTASFSPATAFFVDASAGNANNRFVTAIFALGSGIGTGVAGYGGSSSGSYGVSGVSNSANGTGMYGQSTGADSTGVHGYTSGNVSPNMGGSGVVGEGYGTNFGVKGISQSGTGVYGTTAGGYGLLGQTGTGGTFGLYGSGLVNGSVAIGGQAYNGGLAAQFSGPVTHYGPLTILQGSGGPSNAFIVGPGVTKNAAVQVADGTHRLMHCVEAPEPWFEDFGEGTLAGGKAEVKLEEGFASTVDTRTLHVFLTAHDGDYHLHVAGKSATGFSVGASASAEAAARGRRGADGSGTFTWRVVAKRKDVSGERLAKVTLPTEVKQPVPLPKLEPFAPKGPPKKGGE